MGENPHRVRGPRPRNRSGPCYARALLLDPEAISPEAISHQPPAEITKEYGPSLAPIHAFLQGILPLVAHVALPVTPATTIYKALQQAEQARRDGRHQDMIAARRDLKTCRPIFFKSIWTLWKDRPYNKVGYPKTTLWSVKNKEIRMNQTDADTTLVEDVIDRYTKTWSLLLQYDENRLERPAKTHPSHIALDYDQAKNAIAIFKATLVARGEASELVGMERGQYLQSILDNIHQTFDGQELYPTTEEKAAHILYFVIKDHPFSDGNKRIGSLLFLLYLNKNGLLERSGINDNGLVTLALLIAESDPRQKDLMIRLVLNLLVSKTEND